jgi:hypothetical protein
MGTDTIIITVCKLENKYRSVRHLLKRESVLNAEEEIISVTSPFSEVNVYRTQKCIYHNKPKKLD